LGIGALTHFHACHGESLPTLVLFKQGTMEAPAVCQWGTGSTGWLSGAAASLLAPALAPPSHAKPALGEQHGDSP